MGTEWEVKGEYLKVEVIDGGEGAQAVVTEPEVRASCFRRHLDGEEEAFAVNPLWQAFQDARNQEHMPILDGANLKV